MSRADLSLAGFIADNVPGRELRSGAVSDATTQTHGQVGPERDEDVPGGPAHPPPGYRPPVPEPDPERAEDEPGGPAHPAPGHLPARESVG
jgi:hypothetical protein